MPVADEMEEAFDRIEPGKRYVLMEGPA